MKKKYNNINISCNVVSGYSVEINKTINIISNVGENINNVFVDLGIESEILFYPQNRILGFSEELNLIEINDDNK